MKQVMKLALLMASTLTISTCSFAVSDGSSTLDQSQEILKRYNGHQVTKNGFKASPNAHKLLLAQSSQIEHFTKKFKATALPTKVDHSDLSVIEDQGQLGSCTANALAGAMFSRQLSQYLDSNPHASVAQGKQVVSQLSRLFIYYCERAIEKTLKDGDVGASLSSGLLALTMYGAPPESEWQYNDNEDGQNKYSKQPPAKCYRDAKANKDLDAAVHATIDPTDENVIEIIKQAVANKIFVPIGFAVFPEFESQDVASTGILPMPNLSQEQTIGGHAVRIVGYDDVAKCFIVANSYGTGWGLSGFFKMPYDYFKQSFTDGSGPLVSEIYLIDHVSNASPAASKKSLLSSLTHLSKLADLGSASSDALKIFNDFNVGFSDIKVLAESIDNLIHGAEYDNRTD